MILKTLYIITVLITYITLWSMVIRVTKVCKDNGKTVTFPLLSYVVLSIVCFIPLVNAILFIICFINLTGDKDDILEVWADEEEEEV